MGDPKAMMQNEGIRSQKSFWYQTINSPIKYLFSEKYFQQFLMTISIFSGTSKSSLKNDFKKNKLVGISEFLARHH